MSGDVQPRKRKDKKRKKDDEDTVKETPVQKAPSAGAAQAATQAGDIQMHVHSDHGTGGHWCAKIVFFILLAGLGALIGLILIENRGLSNDDTPLSESRYAEYFSGWVDENREDDHHHEEILNALNELDDHDEDDGHDDVELPGDGEPFAEEEDHDDEEHADEDEDEEDEEEEPKLDDDEIEEIVATEQKVAEQEASVAEDNDDDEDDDDNQPDVTNDNNDDDEDGDDDDDDEIAKEIDDLADADDDDNTPFDEEDDDENDENDAARDDQADDDGDDGDDDDDFENFVDNDGGEEEYLSRVKQEQQQSQQKQQEKQETREESSQIPARPSDSSSYQEELDRANRQLDEWKNPKKALESFQSLLAKDPQLVGAMVGKARALDLIAEQQQSNSVLDEAIAAYLDVLDLGSVVDNGVFLMAAERYIDRVRFRGQYLRAVPVQLLLIKRFDAEPKFRNELAVTYLLANRLAEAKAVLHETLMRWIEDGFALVHYGFVLKNHDKDMAQAAQFLQEGIDTGHPGTQDGRFYFHLGDALQRLGRQQEALKVYEQGAKKKLFLSKYQRSLYNVDNLKSRAFWTIEQTKYASSLKLISSQWSAIRDEGMSLLNSEGTFKDESENLRDTGDWKQFELFTRGNRIASNCAKAPVTCKLVEQFTAARTCKRGQVKFSVMHPGTHVWPHCGPTNCRIRAHLGLKVPSGTFLRVAEQTKSWEDGQWLIFDDSFEHEVWHNGTETRLVLIVDFWHPDLSETERKTLSPI